jgi:hypothetical protein
VLSFAHSSRDSTSPPLSFLKALGEVPWLRAAPAGRLLLAEVRRLPQLAARRVKADPLTARDVERTLAPKPWFRPVYANRALNDEVVDRDAYVLCLLEQLHAAIRVRDVFAHPSERLADPRAKLLDGAAWTGVRTQVLAGLSLPLDVDGQSRRSGCWTPRGGKPTRGWPRPAIPRGSSWSPARTAGPS